MKRLFLAVVLLCAAHSFAAIAYVGNGSGTCIQNTSTTHSCTINITGSSNSHAEIVACAIHVTTVRVTGVTDSGGSTYSLQAGFNQSTNIRLEVWTTGITGSVASTTITINTDSDSDFTCAAAEYSGALAFGDIFNQGQASSSTSTATTASTLDNNNWSVGTFAVNGSNTITANVGNLRQTATSANAAVAIGDNTTASAGSNLFTRVSISPNSQSEHVAVELRTVTPSGGVKHRTTQS